MICTGCTSEFYLNSMVMTMDTRILPSPYTIIHSANYNIEFYYSRSVLKLGEKHKGYFTVWENDIITEQTFNLNARCFEYMQGFNLLTNDSKSPDPPASICDHCPLVDISILYYQRERSTYITCVLKKNDPDDTGQYCYDIMNRKIFSTRAVRVFMKGIKGIGECGLDLVGALELKYRY